MIAYYLFTNIAGLISIIGRYWVMYVAFITFNVVCICLDAIMAIQLHQSRFWILMAISVIVSIISIKFFIQISTDWSQGIQIWPVLRSTTVSTIRITLVALDIVRLMAIVILLNDANRTFALSNQGLFASINGDFQRDKIIIFLLSILDLAIYVFTNIYGIIAVMYNRLSMLITCIIFNIFCLILDSMITNKMQKTNRHMWLAVVLSLVIIPLYICFVIMANLNNINKNNAKA